jgi:4-hydroxybenzoate polyprenyltransferase
VLASTAVWAMSLVSGGVAVASVVVNDYFDYPVDLRNAPHKPLPSGHVAPDVALLFSSAIYCAVLIGACFMENATQRAIVAFSAAATLLYTPLFKRLTAVKNAAVASVIALAPIAGGRLLRGPARPPACLPAWPVERRAGAREASASRLETPAAADAPSPALRRRRRRAGRGRGRGGHAAAAGALGLCLLRRHVPRDLDGHE